MKVLSIVWFSVYPPLYGGQKGTAYFNDFLSKEVDLTCLCSKNNEVLTFSDYEILAQLPIGKTQFFNLYALYRIFKTVKKINAPYIIIEYPYYAWQIVAIRKLLPLKFIIHEHNIEYNRFKAMGKWWWPILHKYERWACRKADLVLCKTLANKETLVQKFGLDPKLIQLVSYGVCLPTPLLSKIDIRQKHGIQPREKILLFAGTLDYTPNAKAVETIFDLLVPELEKIGLHYKIVICGRCRENAFQYLKRLKNERVIYAGEVKNLEAYYYYSDVFINPVKQVNGVQTKSLEAIAYGLSVVCFESASMGIDTTATGAKLLTVENNNWKAFATTVNPSTQKKEKTPASFFEIYDWKNIVTDVANRIKNL